MKQAAPKRRFDLHRIFSSAEIVLVGKDLGAIWRNKGARALLMLLPVVLVVLVPLLYSVAISFLPTEESLAMPERLAAMLHGLEGHGPRQQWMAAFTTLLCPMLFLCVPVMCSVVAASQVLVGEKEGGTLETLMLSAMDTRSLLHAKVTCCTLLSILMGAPYFLNWEWIACLVLVMPAVALFSVVFVSWELCRVHSAGEALQTMGYLLLPLLLLYLIQFTGVFRVTAPLLIAIAVGLGVLSVILFNLTSRQFQPERLLSRSPEG